MKYVEHNLTQGERIMYTARRHWIVCAIPAFVAVFFALPGLGLLFEEDARFGGFVMLCIAAGVSLLGWLSINGFEFAVTNRRLIYRKGIISISTDELFLDKVESDLVKQGLLGRWLGCGSILLRGTGGSAEPFRDISDPLLLRKRI
jgi:hypothetical protein